MILAYVDIRPILFILGVLVLLLVVYIFCRIKKKKDKFGKIFGLSFCVYVGLFTFFLTEIGPFVGQRDTREFIMTWKLVEEENSYYDQPHVVLEFKDFPGNIIGHYSKELFNHLEAQGTDQIKVIFSTVSDYGNVRGYSAESIAGLREWSREWSYGGTFGSPTSSPWD